MLYGVNGQPLPAWWVWVDGDGGVVGCGYASQCDLENQPVPPGCRAVRVSAEVYQVVQLAPRQFRLDDEIRPKLQINDLKATPHTIDRDSSTTLTWSADRAVKFWANDRLLDGSYRSPQNFSSPKGADGHGMAGAYVLWVEDAWCWSNRVTVVARADAECSVDRAREANEAERQ